MQRIYSNQKTTMIKFKNKYRIPSARWQSWDYANPGMYFLTICTHQRLPFFGEIIQAEMMLSPMGIIAYACWDDIPKHFPNIELGAFVIMPNHVHGILVVNERLEDPKECDDDTKTIFDFESEQMSLISPQAGSVSAAIRSYKAAVTRTIRPNHADFKWQKLFHDRVIRNQGEYQRIEQYILQNPARWGKDKFRV
jgi:REP element-mobilizing transposase RayT